MTGKRIIVIPMAAAVLAILGFAGWEIGTRIGRAHARRSVAIEAADRANAVLNNGTDIRTGEPFPDLEIWTANGQHATRLSEVLRSGGYVLYVSPECGVCFMACLEFERWIEAGGQSVQEAIIVTDDPDNTMAFERALRDSLVTVPFYCDVQRALRDRHKIVETPVFFILSAEGLELMQAGVFSQPSGFVPGK